MKVDHICEVCGVAMIPTSAWEADDPDRAIQGIMRFVCPSCAAEGLLKIRKGDIHDTSGRLKVMQR